MADQTIYAGLGADVARGLDAFVRAVESICGADLKSVTLYGSGAEARLRQTSDVNVLVVLSRFEPTRANALRQPVAAAEAAIKLTAMFLLESEIDEAAQAFGQKFADMARRHRVLYGNDPFAGVAIPRAAVVARLKQVLLNMLLRVRAAYIERGATPERLSAVIAESAGPLRACAATLRELQGLPLLPPKEALSEFASQASGGDATTVLGSISMAREGQVLAAEAGDTALLRMIEWAAALRASAQALG